jgi:hypothetical protein
VDAAPALYDPLADPWWEFDQAFAWVAYRDPERVRVAQSAWSRHNPCRYPSVWSDPDTARMLPVLIRALQDNPIRASRRDGKRGPRIPIGQPDWCDGVISWFPVPRRIGQERPQFYDRNTPDVEFAADTAEPWRDVLISSRDLLKIFPPTAERAVPEPEPESNPEVPVYSFPALVKFVKTSPRRGEEARRADATAYFRLAIPRKTVRAAIAAAGVRNPPGRPRATV